MRDVSHILGLSKIKNTFNNHGRQDPGQRPG